MEIEVQGKLTREQFRQVFDLLGQPPDRYKPGSSGRYYFGSQAMFWQVTVGLTDAVCAYLEDIGAPYERQTARRWRP